MILKKGFGAGIIIIIIGLILFVLVPDELSDCVTLQFGKIVRFVENLTIGDFDYRCHTAYSLQYGGMLVVAGGIGMILGTLMKRSDEKDAESTFHPNS